MYRPTEKVICSTFSPNKVAGWRVWHRLFVGIVLSSLNMEEILKKIILSIRRFFREKLHYKAEDLPYYITILVAFILFVVGLNAFVDITEELVKDNLNEFDAAVTSRLFEWRGERLTLFLIFITHVGNTTGYLIVTTLLVAYFLIRHRSWKFILQTVVVLLLATLSNMALKEVFNRARPDIDHLVAVHSLSYPSGHAMSAMGFYGFLIFLTARYKMNYLVKFVLILGLGTLIFLIGLSRVYLGVHFPSDVVAGFIGGLIWVTFCAIVFDVIDLYRKRQQRISELLAIREKEYKSQENE
jgi:membrane-associated phospholipid phosphatase